MRVERITPGRRAPARLAGSILARDLAIGGERWSKGRRLTVEDLHAVAAAPHGPAISVVVPEAGELHEDDAALRLATAVAGPGLTLRGPAQSRVDLLADESRGFGTCAGEGAAAGADRVGAVGKLDPAHVLAVLVPDQQVVDLDGVVA